MFGIYTTLVYGGFAAFIAVILLRLAMKKWPVEDGEGVELRDDTFETGEFVARKEEPGTPKPILICILLAVAIGVIIASINMRPKKRIIVLTIPEFNYSFVSTNTNNQYLRILDNLFRRFPHNNWTSSTVEITSAQKTHELKSEIDLSLAGNFTHTQDEYKKLTTQIQTLIKETSDVLVLNDALSASLLKECNIKRQKSFNTKERKANKDAYSMLHLFAGMHLETLLIAKDANTIVFIITPQTKSTTGRITVFANPTLKNFKQISNPKTLNKFINEYITK